MWRPIRGPLRDAPLAVCDALSVDPGDLVPSDLVYRDRVGETYSVTYNPAHRWFYVPEMRADEALLQWKLFVAVHTNAPVALSRARVHDMMRQKWGRIKSSQPEQRGGEFRHFGDDEHTLMGRRDIADVGPQARGHQARCSSHAKREVQSASGRFPVGSTIPRLYRDGSQAAPQIRRK